MSDDEIISLLETIQRAIDGKNLAETMEYYHADVIYIGPAFSTPVQGKETLQEAFGRHFSGPQRTKVEFKDIRVNHISDMSFVVYCVIEGSQTLYFSSQRFKGWLSRVFMVADGKPLIIHEHFSLAQ
jgi:ketosteroid isomerase-like protein